MTTYQSYTAEDPGLRVNSHFFETERGVVLVDTQLHLPYAEEVLEQIRSTTSGNLLYIVTTHAHPDHWYGNTIFRRAFPNVPIITCRSVSDEIQATALSRRERWDRLFADRIPKAEDLVFPDCVFSGRLTLKLGEHTLQVDEYGPAEAGAHTVVYVEEDRTLITGDIVDNKKHPWIGERNIDNWCAILEEFRQRYRIDTILPGHGAPGGAELLEESSQWLDNYRTVVQKHLESEALHLTEEGAQKAFEEIVSGYPDFFLPHWGEQTNLGIGLRKLDSSFVGNSGKPIRTADGKM